MSAHTDDTTDAEAKNTKLLGLCGECDFIAAKLVESPERARDKGEDPAQEHFLSTDHGCGSFEPAEDSPLNDAWEIVHGNGELVEERSSHNIEVSSDLGETIEYPTELSDIEFDKIVIESSGE